MLCRIVAVPALLIACGSTASAQAPVQNGAQVAVVEMQSAIVNTKEGQKGVAKFDAMFLNDKARLEKEQADLQAARVRLGQKRRLAWLPLRHTLIVRQRKKLASEIAGKTALLNRDTQQVRAEADRERTQFFQALAPRAIQVIERIAKENGYLLVLEAGSAPAAVRSSAPNITADLVRLYDQMFSSAR